MRKRKHRIYDDEIYTDFGGFKDLRLGHVLCLDTGAVTGELPGEKSKDPAFGMDGILVTEDMADEAKRLGYAVVYIAENTLKTMLKMNYNWKGIEYGFNDSSKTAFMTYLRDQVEPSRMYEICITYNEFLRNPDAFKQLIENPKVVRKWNFWSRRKKYKKELFDEKFQTMRR